MAHHKFRLGQIVQYVPDRTQTVRSAGLYRIMRVLPHSTGGEDQQYRIKSTAEPFERVAQESQLSLGVIDAPSARVKRSARG